MGLETGTTIGELNENWPLGGDGVNRGDDHLRLVKDILKKDAASMATAEATEIVKSDVAAGWQIWGTLLMCWGQQAGEDPIVFPRAFKVEPVITHGVVTTAAATNARFVSTGNGSITTTGFQPYVRNASGDAVDTSFGWMAIGEALDADKQPLTVQTLSAAT